MRPKKKKKKWGNKEHRWNLNWEYFTIKLWTTDIKSPNQMLMYSCRRAKLPKPMMTMYNIKSETPPTQKICKAHTSKSRLQFQLINIILHHRYMTRLQINLDILEPTPNSTKSSSPLCLGYFCCKYQTINTNWEEEKQFDALIIQLIIVNLKK